MREKGRYLIFHDDVLIAMYDHPSVHPWFPLTLSGDGSTVAHRVRDERTGQDLVTIGDRVQGPWNDTRMPVLSPDGSRFAYWAEGGEGDEAYMMTSEGVTGPYFPQMAAPVFSADGKHLAYVAEPWDEEARYISVGLRRVSCPDGVETVFVSADGSRVGVVRRLDNSNRRVWIDGKEGQAFGRIGRPRFSHDGSRVAYSTRREGQDYLVVDSELIEAPGILSDLVFSPDGRSVGYGSRRGRELRWEVVRLR